MHESISELQKKVKSTVLDALFLLKCTRISYIYGKTHAHTKQYSKLMMCFPFFTGESIAGAKQHVGKAGILE